MEVFSEMMSWNWYGLVHSKFLSEKVTSTPPNQPVDEDHHGWGEGGSSLKSAIQSYLRGPPTSYQTPVLTVLALVYVGRALRGGPSCSGDQRVSASYLQGLQEPSFSSWLA